MPATSTLRRLDSLCDVDIIRLILSNLDSTPRSLLHLTGRSREDVRGWRIQQIARDMLRAGNPNRMLREGYVSDFIQGDGIYYYEAFKAWPKGYTPKFISAHTGVPLSEKGNDEYDEPLEECPACHGEVEQDIGSGECAEYDNNCGYTYTYTEEEDLDGE